MSRSRNKPDAPPFPSFNSNIIKYVRFTSSTCDERTKYTPVTGVTFFCLTFYVTLKSTDFKLRGSARSIDVRRKYEVFVVERDRSWLFSNRSDEKPISFAQIFYLPCTHERRRPRNDTGNSRAVFPATLLANIYRKVVEVLFKFHRQSAPRYTENNFNDLSA